MKRLFLHFSYIGTNYRGLQRTVSNNPLAQRSPDLDTVQGIIEFGLRKILHLKELTLWVSSRTDAKVHACHSTGHFDLNENQLVDKSYVSPEKICESLNLFLEKNDCEIRINRVIEISPEFSCRNAFSRTYEFRIGVLNGWSHNVPAITRLSSALDIRDLSRCILISQPFDVAAVQEACKLFVGEWDFTTFMKTTPEFSRSRVKTLRRFSVSPALIQDGEWDSIYGNISKPPYDVYNFTVEGSGFLRRQVRRMAGALVALGRGIISSRDILWMLENPSEKNWIQKVQTLPPHGLYLKQIKYPKFEVFRGYLS